jgi:hypothetical protein
MMHLMKDDSMNLENFEAFVTWLEEAAGDPNYVNTTERALTKLCQGDRDVIALLRRVPTLNFRPQLQRYAKHEAWHRGLSEELKGILSTQDHPEE